MKNISFNKESIKLRKNNSYIIMDGVYLNDLKNDISKLNPNNLYEEIRDKVFIYNDTPFAEFTADSDLFSIERIKHFDYGNIAHNDKSLFSTDSGLLIICDMSFITEFIKLFDYYILVDSPFEIIDTSFWQLITKDFPFTSFAMILSPGIDSGCDFIGSGLYQIV